MTSIHASAIIDPSAKIGKNVEIGPFSLIGPYVEIGDDCVIGAGVQLVKNVRMGPNNHVHAYSVLGGDPAHRDHCADDVTWLVIGERNIIHEYAVIHRGAKVCGGVTQIGSDNYIMCYVHFGHDCQIGNHVTVVNNVNLAGSVIVEDYAYLGAYSACVQRIRVGSSALLNPKMIAKRNIMPYVIVDQEKACAINLVGLQRRGYSRDKINKIKQYYRMICREGRLMQDIREDLASEECDIAKALSQFLAHGPILR